MPEKGDTVRFYGQVLHVPFETEADLSHFLPSGLVPADAHRAFLKAERLKMRAPGGAGDSPAFTQYQQICVTTMASPSGMEPRHRNLLMWEDRPWGIAGSLASVKRYGAVEMSYVFEADRRSVAEGAEVPFQLDVRVAGFPVLQFAGALDGRQRVEAPPFNGFFVGGEAGTPLRALTLDRAELSHPLHGRGEMTFGATPHERSQEPGSGPTWPATLFGAIKVSGCVLHDLEFVRTYGAEFTPVA